MVVPGPYLLSVLLLRDRIPDQNAYPFSLPVVRHLDELKFHPRVTFIVGENGSGKSTLIEALAAGCHLNPEGGSRNFNFKTRASHSHLDQYLRLSLKAGGLPHDSFFLRAESFYNVATEVENAGVGKNYAPIDEPRSLHAQSHGESFFALFKYRFGFRSDPSKKPKPGLYFLDEPEAALSPRRQLEFLALLHQYCNEGSQFIIATHSPIIMAYPESWIYVLKTDGIVQTPYEETDHYLVTRGFLDHPKRTLKVLLAEDEEPSSDADAAR